jgi:hypothetical protein
MNKKLIKREMSELAVLLAKKIEKVSYNIEHQLTNKVKMSCWVLLEQKAKVNIRTGMHYMLLVVLKEKLIKSVDSNSQ